MRNLELLLLGGRPCAGKSTTAREFVRTNAVPHASHFSIGERLRGICSGRIASAHVAEVIEGAQTLKENAALPYDLINKVFDEFCSEEPSGLVLVDNYPAYHETLLGFNSAIQRTSARVVAYCHFDVPDKVVYSRDDSREQRWEGITESMTRRLADYEELIAPTLAKLAARYPAHVLDGTDPVEVNVARLQAIYATEVGSA
jgi:adenylate kinase family enzyme